MIVGHQRNLDYLERVLSKGTLAHAYLFSGPEAVGKKTAAMAVAAALLCCEKVRRTLGGCGSCDDCTRVGALEHPDVIFLARDHPLAPADNTREISITSVHELARRIALRSWHGSRRVVIIDGAEALSRDAQSALLKILEEPLAEVIFFLITAAPGGLLPTIRSRAVPLGFTSLSDAELGPLLADAPASERGPLRRLARGRPGLLRKLILDRKFLESFRQKEAQFLELFSTGLDAKFQFSEAERASSRRSEGGGGDDPLAAFLRFLLDCLRQELHRRLEENPRERPAFPGGLWPQAAFLKSVLEKLSLLETTAANRRLLADSVLFDLEALIGKA